MQDNQIIKIHGTDYKNMTKELCKASLLYSLIPSCDSRIFLKPNLVVAGPASLGATTHPEVLAGIIEYLKENGFNNITLTESSWYGEKTEDAFVAAGYKNICEEYGVPFVDAKGVASHKVDCKGMDISVSDVVNDIDFLINVPVLKGHCQVKMTCALKNIKGLVPDVEKKRFHALGINKPVAHLASAIKQDFIIIDNICGDLDFEEGGNPITQNCIMAALDPVLVDAYACKLLNIPISSVSYIGIAEALGAGSSNLDNLEIINLNESDISTPISQSSRILDVAYAAEAVDACSSCYGNLVPALLRLQDEGLLEKLDTKISIGQGHSGKTGKLGVGNCTSCFDKCIKGCPPSSEDIYRELKAYIEE